MNDGVNNKFIPLLFSVNKYVHMQGTPMNKNIPVRQASGRCMVGISSPDTTHLRVQIREFILFV